MSLTRKMLKAMGIEEEKIDQIIEAHSETVDSLKKERDELKESAEEVVSLRKELEKANKALEEGEKSSYKVKYDALKEDFENYKKDISDKETKASKRKAYEELLKEAGVSEKRLEAVLKVSDIDSIELSEDGKIKDSEGLMTSIKSEWADFITTKNEVGSKTATPPSSNGGKTMTREQIFAKDKSGRYVMSASDRQQAIIDNSNLFQ